MIEHACVSIINCARERRHWDPQAQSEHLLLILEVDKLLRPLHEYNEAHLQATKLSCQELHKHTQIRRHMPVKTCT